MADYGATYTDKTIAELDKEIQAVYKEAEKDIQKKMDEFDAKYKIKEQKYQQKVNSGQMTQEEFDKWKKGQVFQGQQWQAKKDQILDTIHHSNEIATKIINGQGQNVFMVNANYMSYDMEHGAGVNFGFGLYDQNTVANLIANDPKLLPEWKINEKKDYIWSQKKLNNAITQGIIQGESLDKISKRISDKLASSNKNKMKTFARTAMTGAQNSGRQMQLENAQKLGIELQKEWMATLDAHTRDSHKGLDGEQVDVDKPFTNGLMYPGDPDGDAAEIYNCRCTMVSDIKKYPSTYNRYDNISGQKIKNMSYKEWEDAKKNSKDLSPIPLTYKKFKSNEQKALMDLFKDKSMSGLYKDMKDFDKTEANQFYKTLGEAGKPSEVWQQYLDGTLDSKTSDKIDAILNQYGLESGVITQPVDLKTTFADKKMSNVYNEMKAVDKTTANKFYNELKDMGKPSDVWDKYLKGELSEADTKKIESYLEKMVKTESTTMVKPGEIKTLEEAQKALKAAEDAVKNKIPDTKFEGIWKEPVTYADYPAKEASIQAKKDYYNDKIAIWQKNIEQHDGAEKVYAQFIEEAKENLKKLEEFEKNGKAYSQLFKDVEDAKKKVNDLTPADAVFSQKRKDAALWAKNDAEYKKLDKYYDKVAKEVHDKKTSLEHEGYYHYTWGSGPFNQPLAGFNGSWSESAFKGVGKVDIDDNGYGNKIRGLTNLVEKSKYDKDVWVQSGQTTDTLAGFLNIPRGALNKMSESELQQFVGVEKEIPQFISGAINKGGGSYTPGDTLFNIYCPEGSEMLYVRSDGYFKKNEHEMILQRGGTYKIDKIYWGKDETTGSKKLIVDLELHPERGYDKFQQ